MIQTRNLKPLLTLISISVSLISSLSTRPNVSSIEKYPRLSLSHIYSLIAPHLSLFLVMLHAMQDVMDTVFSWPGIKPVPPALETQSLNHWTARKVPVAHLCKPGLPQKPVPTGPPPPPQPTPNLLSSPLSFEFFPDTIFLLPDGFI